MRHLSGVKAIETRYKGYRFRSRTEARWAVFFDALGYSWSYEDEGFSFRDGTHYLPDFDVVCEGGYAFYAEVKGENAGLSLDELRKLMLLGATSHARVLLLDGVPDFRMYASTKEIEFCLMGGFDIKWHVANDDRDKDHPHAPRVMWGLTMLQQGDATWLSEEDVAMVNRWLHESKYNRLGFAMHSHKQRIWGDEHANFWYEGCPELDCALVDAIGYARSARFEHGERPFHTAPW